jgi:ABC-2 type transport system ATP-binding protein
VRKTLATAGALCLLALWGAPSAHARDAKVTSFDGTQINAHFYPAEGLAAGKRAPTILQGPGWSMTGETQSEGAAGAGDLVGAFGITGIDGFIERGYNVLTWDPRGFGQSGGTVQIDDPRYEGRDVQALLDFVAAQPEAQLDCRKPKAKRKGKGKRKKVKRRACLNPRVGMAGGSYGGGIQLVTAAIDKRVDAIAPTIAWNSLLTSLFPEDNIKLGWGSVLVAAGIQGSLPGGLSSPATAAGRQDPHFYSILANGLATGKAPRADLEWMESKGPKQLLKRVRIPTLLIQGTPDTLFPLDEAVANFQTIRANKLRPRAKKRKEPKSAAKKKRKVKAKRVPAKMIWFCGGHGACFTGAGPSGYVAERQLDWFDKYLKDRPVDTGPTFAWIADDGEVRDSGDYPLKPAGELRGLSAGTLPIAPGQGSGGLIFASAAPVAVNVPIPGPQADANVVGAPKLAVTYQGNAVPQQTYAYAQIVNPRNGFVLGNIATPIPLTLDGQSHTITRELETVAARAPAGGGYQLQLTPSSTLYDVQRSTGTVDFTSIDVTLPLGEPSAAKAKRKKPKRKKKRS